MKIIQNIYLAIIALIFSILFFTYALFCYTLTPVSNNTEIKEVEIKPGGIKSIANTLYSSKLIKNKLTFVIYVKITGQTNLKSAKYSLSESMGVRKIVKILSLGKGENTNQVTITFKEGWNVRKIAKVIEENTNNSIDDVYNTLKDENYLKQLIGKYWFLSEEILNQEIYYPLEGYLYPNTYNFSSKDVSVKDIIETMLSETEKQLNSKKDEIESNTWNIHQIITMASILELEGNTDEDRSEIAGVFKNRIKKGMNLGSDVTTYYGLKIDMGDRDLYTNEVNTCNQYNTRCSTYKGLPISPICNPTLGSIMAVINASNNDYLYFVADKNKKIYFSKTLKEHENIIRELKQQKLWIEY